MMYDEVDLVFSILVGMALMFLIFSPFLFECSSVEDNGEMTSIVSVDEQRGTVCISEDNEITCYDGLTPETVDDSMEYQKLLQKIKSN